MDKTNEVYECIEMMKNLTTLIDLIKNVIAGWMLHAVNLFPYNLAVQIIGVAGWLWVGILWHDRALIVLNSIGVFLLGLGLLKHMVGL